MFNSFDVTVMRGFGSGQLKPVAVVFPLGLETKAGGSVGALTAVAAGACAAVGCSGAAGGWVAAGWVAVGWLPHPESRMLNMAIPANIFKQVDLFISSSLE
jgi:hypothetical protein